MQSLMACKLAIVHTLAFVASAAHTPYMQISQAGGASSPVPQNMDPFAGATILDVPPSTMQSISEASIVFAADVTTTTSSTSYQNHPGFEPSKTTPLPSAPSFAAPAVVACWTSSACTRVLSDFAAAYAVSGDITDPNERGVNGGADQSRVFQAQFCGNAHYHDVLSTDNTTSPNTSMKACLQCFTDAGLDTTFRYTPSMDFVWGIYNFCYSDEPSLFYLLEQLFTWMKIFDAPTKIDVMPAKITANVDGLASRFTFTSGMNEARGGAVTYISTPNQPTDSPASLWWQTSLSSGGPIPTEYLAQVPKNWPYTEYGIARRKKTTSWPLVNPNATTKTVAWLYHEVLWNARPMFTPKASKAVLDGAPYYPALKDWTHSFKYETVPIAPALTTTPPVPKSTMASGARTPVIPTILQSSVEPKSADSDAEIRASMASSKSLAEKSKSSVAAMQVTGAPKTSDGSSSMLEDTMLQQFSGLIGSMRDVLDGKASTTFAI